MGCLKVSLTLQGGNLGAKVNLNKGIIASAAVVSESIFPQVTFTGLRAGLNELTSRLQAQCSIVCNLADLGKYLDVTPSDVQWITDDVGVFFDVESNVEWIVVTS